MSEAHTIPVLGRLQTVELREVWSSEPYAFTPWLAQPDSLQFLADELGLPGLELVEMEQQVDVFSADIVARAPDTGETVLIENQIEKSDHTHLGQVLTYAAGLDAATIVWITRRFTDGHRAALDWLNRITTEQFAFFGVEVEAVRIGDSVPAPRFKVIARPNAWAREVKSAARAAGMGPQADERMAYWRGYEAAALAGSAPVHAVIKPIRDTNYYVPIGPMKLVYLTAFRAASQGCIGAYLGLQGPTGRGLFSALQTRREDIEGRFGGPLEWIEAKSGGAYRLHAGRLDASSDEADWPRQHAWLADTMKHLALAVGPALESIARNEEPEEVTA